MIKRTAAYPVIDLLVQRWSPRAMSGESISRQELMSLFEAARWAPSSYNGQPWRFIYALRDTSAWPKLFNLLVPANQIWAKNAAVLILVVSRTKFEFNNKPARTHTFDTGAACQNLALQGYKDGFVVHGMEGFDYDAAKRTCNIPDDYTVEAMFAVGRPGNKADLPKELQEREVPSDRFPVEKLVFEGTFTEK